MATGADTLWWYIFTSEWNGISMLWDLNRANPDVNLFSDASGSWECGAYWGSQWFHLHWPLILPIAINELIPVVIAWSSYIWPTMGWPTCPIYGGQYGCSLCTESYLL